MPRTRSQIVASPSPEPAPAGKQRRPARSKKKRVTVVEPSPPSPPLPPPATSSAVTGGSSGVPAPAAQSSIPGLTVPQLRSIMTEQRKQFGDAGYVDYVDEVWPGMTRLSFNFQYVYGITQKRHAKNSRRPSSNKPPPSVKA